MLRDAMQRPAAAPCDKLADPTVVMKRPAAAPCDKVSDKNQKTSGVKKRPAAAPCDTDADKKKKTSGDNAPRDGLGKVFAAILDKVGSIGTQTLCSVLKGLGGLRLASACSGSNITNVIAKEFFKSITQEPIVDLYSCESHVGKQSFLKWVNDYYDESDSHVFSDIKNLRASTATCISHGKECPIPSGKSGLFCLLVASLARTFRSSSRRWRVPRLGARYGLGILP
jgi:hypothetical protein